MARTSCSIAIGVASSTSHVSLFRLEMHFSACCLNCPSETLSSSVISPSSSNRNVKVPSFSLSTASESEAGPVCIKISPVLFLTVSSAVLSLNDTRSASNSSNKTPEKFIGLA
ncbi:hypothetical protein HAX54_031665 [Datura stramonium]|uniref:Uncharacterized protein n=1 Tax=Datura stramonium TaxID=4076 RepID=A0ABS8V9U6_DATST|nr:hypothetical protein [Datura stramonium]